MQLSKEQIKQLKDFISKIPESTIRPKYERIVHLIEPTEYATQEQLQELVTLSIGLPNELQSFPQAFLAAVKNEAAQDAENKKVKNKAELLDVAAESIADVKTEKKFTENETSLQVLGDNESPEVIEEEEIIEEEVKATKSKAKEEAPKEKTKKK